MKTIQENVCVHIAQEVCLSLKRSKYEIDIILQGIAKGMSKFNEENLLKCQQLAEKCSTTTDNFNELSNALEQINPVQCFDILNDLCRKFALLFFFSYEINLFFFVELKAILD